jgi:hypothetical protein
MVASHRLTLPVVRSTPDAERVGGESLGQARRSTRAASTEGTGEPLAEVVSGEVQRRATSAGGDSAPVVDVDGARVDGHGSMARTARATIREHQRVDGLEMREIVDGATWAAAAIRSPVQPARRSSSRRRRTGAADV